MIYSINELREIIKNGENSAVEFKAADVRKESIAREIVSFSNTQGGVILVGVNDDGIITGLTATKDYEEWIMNLARNNVTPAVQVEFEEYRLDGESIACLTVPRGKDKPYQTRDAKYLIRVGSTNRTATQPELLRLFQASGAFHFDATPVERTSLKNLNLSKIDSYFSRYGIEFSQEDEADKAALLMNSDILGEQGEVTVGGMLIFGLNASRYLPQAGISFAHFHGTNINDELIDKQNNEASQD